MYDGYLIKINKEIFPMKYMIRNTWSATPRGRRIIEEKYDAYGEKHIQEATHTQTEISFKICNHKNDIHPYILSFLQGLNEISVEYYDDSSDTYQNGIFRADNISWKHMYSNDQEIWYEETQLKLSEK